MFIATGSAKDCPVESNTELMDVLFEELRVMDPYTAWHFLGTEKLTETTTEYTFGNSDDDRIASVAMVDGRVYDSWIL
jgi:hypothetical protein